MAFYAPLGVETALMKCYMVRIFCLGFLEPIHLSDEVHRDCTRAREIYERHFSALTPEERSMGLSIYDIAFDRTFNLLKLGRATPELLDEMIDWHGAAVQATQTVQGEDQGYEFNTVLPDFDYYLGFAALCLSPADCTREQAQSIYRAAARRQPACEAAPGHAPSYRVRNGLVFAMAQRLVGLRSDRDLLDMLRDTMRWFAGTPFASGTFSQHTVEAVEAIQLATETLSRAGVRDEPLYGEVQALFIRYFATRPYTSLADYVCACHNYCYILTALPNLSERKHLIWALIKLTMFRQVQTAMHALMVAKLAVEISDSLVQNRPELLIGQLGTASAAEVRARAEEFRRHLYCAALLHDIGKLLCSNVINAQSHKLGELEFRVLKYHPVTGGEMLERIPELSAFREIALGHHKSFDGRSGYPPEFDNTASPQKIFIDVITVCDSLDAATDHLGRNYAAAKDFPTVLGELRAGRGTRYSGDIVDLLDGDTALQARLRLLLEDGRRKLYYDVHNLIISESDLRPSSERTHDWQYDLDLPVPID